MCIHQSLDNYILDTFYIRNRIFVFSIQSFQNILGDFNNVCIRNFICYRHSSLYRIKNLFNIKRYHFARTFFNRSQRTRQCRYNLDFKFVCIGRHIFPLNLTKNTIYCVSRLPLDTIYSISRRITSQKNIIFFIFSLAFKKVEIFAVLGCFSQHRFANF